MEQLATRELESAKNQLQDMLRPFQQEQNRRQKKSDFLKKCIKSVDKNDFFQLDELLKSTLARNIKEDSYFTDCENIFYELQKFADEKIDQYCVEFKGALTQYAADHDLSLEIDIPRFSIEKGIDGKLDFTNRKTVINQTTVKSIDPKRIIATALKLKQKLYSATFEPQKFIDTLLLCYQKITKEKNMGEDKVIPIRPLYQEYVWSLQNKTFFQNMDKNKFKGYSVDQFAVDLWRFFGSRVSSAEGGYRIKLNAGRGKSLWLIDQNGERRHITHASFIKN